MFLNSSLHSNFSSFSLWKCCIMKGENESFRAAFTPSANSILIRHRSDLVACVYISKTQMRWFLGQFFSIEAPHICMSNIEHLFLLITQLVLVLFVYGQPNSSEVGWNCTLSMWSTGIRVLVWPRSMWAAPHVTVRRDINVIAVNTRLDAQLQFFFCLFVHVVVVVEHMTVIYICVFIFSGLQRLMWKNLIVCDLSYKKLYCSCFVVWILFFSLLFIVFGWVEFFSNFVC